MPGTPPQSGTFGSRLTCMRQNGGTMRELFIFALRLFGMWLVVQSVVYFCSTILQTYAAISRVVGFTGQFGQVLLMMWLVFICYAALAICFLRFAPAIASFFYPADEASLPAVPQRINAMALGKVLLRLLGFYTLIQAIHPLANLCAGIYGGADLSGSPGLQKEFIPLLMYLLLAGVFIFFGGRLMTALAAKDRGGTVRDEEYQRRYETGS